MSRPQEPFSGLTPKFTSLCQVSEDEECVKQGAIWYDSTMNLDSQTSSLRVDTLSLGHRVVANIGDKNPANLTFVFRVLPSARG